MGNRGKAHIALRKRGDYEEVAFYGRRNGTLTRFALVKIPSGDVAARNAVIRQTLTALRPPTSSLEE